MNGNYRLPRPYPIFQLVLTLLSVLLYVSALVFWPLYQFSEELGGQPQRSSPTTADPGADHAARWEGCPRVPPPRAAPDLLGDSRLGERLP